MVAHLLRLKLRHLANLLRRPPAQRVGVVIGLALGAAATIAAVAELLSLRSVDIFPAHEHVVVAGSLVVLGALVLPLVFGADDAFDPRAFALFGISSSRLAWALACAALLSLPALALAIVAFANVATWGRDAASVVVGLASAVLIVVTCVLGARVTTSLASFFLSTRRARAATVTVLLLVLCALVPALALLVTGDRQGRGDSVLARVTAVLELTPLGSAWAAPAQAARGDLAAALFGLAISVAFIAVLLVVWRLLVARLLVTPNRPERAAVHRGLGWFSRVPASPVGVIAARSLSYWGRDRRYLAALAIVPVVPAVMVGTLAIAGVPLPVLALIPVPVMCFFLAWSTLHNDVAFDNTALWMHVAAHTSGAADRVGRLIPPLSLGLLVIVIGVPLTAWAYGSPSIIPAMLGASVCVLLVALGVSSVISASTPYPAVHPGDSPFAQPQVSAAGAAWVQALSLGAVVVGCAPTVVFVVLGVQQGGAWSVAALLVGLASGVAALWAGVRLGGRIFEKRAPELLAFTARY